jgi:hypothetical protein
METIRALSLLSLAALWVIAIIEVIKIKEWSSGKKVAYLLGIILFSGIGMTFFFFIAKKWRLGIASLFVVLLFVVSTVFIT